MFRRLLIVLAVFVVGGMWASSALASTIGQAFTPDSTFSGGFILVQTHETSGNSYTIPYDGTLTSWTYRADGTTSPMALVVVRPTGTAHTWKVVGVSPTVTPATNATNTYTASISVHQGDVIGLWYQNSVDDVKLTNLPTDVMDYYSTATAPSNGFTAGYTANYPGYIYDLSATVDDIDSNSTFVCYSKWEQDGGQVVPSDVGAALIAAGEWAPVALPGNVDGGDNIGAYHLACNPPAGSTPSGQYLSDGGLVSSTAQDGWFVIYTAGSSAASLVETRIEGHRLE